MTRASITILDGLESLTNVGAEAAQKIVEDLSDRRGLKGSWEGIEPDIQASVIEAWRQIINEAVSRNSMSPEDLAMIQALYSRSPALVASHLEKVRQVGSGKFIDQYFRGYGHASIGDCGTTTVFVEGVSMLAAKAIQDWPLYSGQEASTRYMDFSTSIFENPLGTPEGEAIQERWRSFYMKSMPVVKDFLAKKYPRKEGDDAKTHQRAISARAFDILRAFLPAGAHTNLSWTTNLRQAGDKLNWLACHPDPSISAMGSDIRSALSAKYKSSFKEDKDEYITYRSASMLHDYFLESEDFVGPSDFRSLLDKAALSRCEGILRDRPRGVELPYWLSEIGTIQTQFHLDFGSFRDLQRHRAGTMRMPLLTTGLGFHPWYLEAIPPELVIEAVGLINVQRWAIANLNADPVVAQNYVSMGFRVPCRITQSLPAFVYRLELRSSKTVHPTLRAVTHEEIRTFKANFPDITLHVDMDEDSWTLRRGTQTIEEKA